RYIHRPHVDGRFAVDDPFRHAESDPAGLTETGHYANGNPVVAKARHWSDHRIAVRPEGERSIDHRFDSSAAERGHSFERDVETFRDSIEIVREKFVAEVQRRAGNRPRLAIRLIRADEQAVVFLTGIRIPLIIDCDRDLFRMVAYFRNCFGY